MMQLQRELVADCVQFLKSIRRYLCEDCEQPVRREDGGTTLDNALDDDDDDGQTYLNVFENTLQPLPGARAQLIVDCEKLLERLENSANVGTELNGDKETGETNEEPVEAEEDESSYIDMSGANTLRANASSSNVSVVDARDELTAETDEPNDSDDGPFNMAEENSYELTTDQILYDECMQEVSYGEQEAAAPVMPGPRTPTPEGGLADSQCPYGGLPASHLRLQQSPKHGTLFKQEKRLFFDQFKKYYVGLIGKWLLVYGSHNDLRPLQTIFIKAIKLDLSLNEQINEKHLFQIITQTDTKVHFLSPSFQDLNEWIVAIENNLIERVDRSAAEDGGGGATVQMSRKLPLPPCPGGESKDETDLLTAKHVEDGIYEEPSVCLKTDSVSRAKALGYDTPKPCCGKSAENVSNGQVAGICNRQSAANVPVVLSKKPELPPKSADTGGISSTSTPVKSWLKNRFNRTPPESGGETKLSKKALKKLSFEDLPTSEGSAGGADPKSPTKPVPVPTTSPKFTLPTTPTSKGTKINMIISQLEANGQLNLLSKRLNDTNKRYTWVTDGVAS